MVAHFQSSCTVIPNEGAETVRCLYKFGTSLHPHTEFRKTGKGRMEKNRPLICQPSTLPFLAFLVENVPFIGGNLDKM